MKKTIIVVVGSTAIGKSALAIQLAGYFDTEIISADSRQFYKELNAGTAKPDKEELNKIKHHFINSLSIHDPYNVGQFEVDSLACAETIFRKHDVAVAVGGSGLFVDALCEGMDQLPESDLEIRNDLKIIFQSEGIEALQKKLEDLDPEYFRTVDKLNPHRLIRAIEVCLITGKKYSGFRKNQKKKRNFSVLKIGLDDDKEIVYNKINERVDAMMKSGLFEEAKMFYSIRNLNALKTVGYQELFDHLENKINFEDAVALIKQNTRRYAKRQRTWFSRDREIKWFKPGEYEKITKWLEMHL